MAIVKTIATRGHRESYKVTETQTGHIITHTPYPSEMRLLSPYGLFLKGVKTNTAYVFSG